MRLNQVEFAKRKVLLKFIFQQDTLKPLKIRQISHYLS